MLFALSLWGERDVTLALELALDLVVRGFLVAFERQEHDGPLGEAPAKRLRDVQSIRLVSRCPPAPRC